MHVYTIKLKNYGLWKHAELKTCQLLPAVVIDLRNTWNIFVAVTALATVGM